MVYAPSRAEAVKAREVFAMRYRPWYPKAVDVLEDDWERMVAFYDFPEDHSKHLRTTKRGREPVRCATALRRVGLRRDVLPWTLATALTALGAGVRRGGRPATYRTGAAPEAPRLNRGSKRRRLPGWRVRP